ncbi:hypothetical protein HDU93_004480 [Gonapodya sp. JEL0774]|nr:hypothetical protein HDU93_004480 [Gonapodya sp. JEL0774]
MTAIEMAISKVLAIPSKTTTSKGSTGRKRKRKLEQMNPDCRDNDDIQPPSTSGKPLEISEDDGNKRLKAESSEIGVPREDEVPFAFSVLSQQPYSQSFVARQFDFQGEQNVKVKHHLTDLECQAEAPGKHELNDSTRTPTESRPDIVEAGENGYMAVDLPVSHVHQCDSGNTAQQPDSADADDESDEYMTPRKPADKATMPESSRAGSKMISDHLNKRYQALVLEKEEADAEIHELRSTVDKETSEKQRLQEENERLVMANRNLAVLYHGSRQRAQDLEILFDNLGEAPPPTSASMPLLKNLESSKVPQAPDSLKALLIWDPVIRAIVPAPERSIPTVLSRVNLFSARSSNQSPL